MQVIRSQSPEMSTLFSSGLGFSYLLCLWWWECSLSLLSTHKKAHVPVLRGTNVAKNRHTKISVSPRTLHVKCNRAHKSQTGWLSQLFKCVKFSGTQQMATRCAHHEAWPLEGSSGSWCLHCVPLGFLTFPQNHSFKC